MKKHLFLTSLAAIIATTGVAGAAELTMDSIKESLEISSSDILSKPVAADYTYKLADGTASSMASKETPDYAGYVATSAAANNEFVALATGSAVKLGEEMTAANYTYSSKDAEGNATMVAGTTAVAELTKGYESDYINITVSSDSEPTVDIANYVNGEYSLHQEADGTIVLYQNGALELDSPEMLTKLKSAYENDSTAVAGIYEALKAYKEYNEENHDAIADIITADNATIDTIAANKASYETAAGELSTAVANYNASVEKYNNSLGATLDARVVESVVATANMSPVTEPAPDAKSYEYTLADGTASSMASKETPDYAGYEATSAAANNEFVALADGSAVKLGETMTADSYTYSSKDAEGKATMVAGTTAVAELTKEYESTYGNIMVSSDSEPTVDIANYKQTADNGTVYKLVKDGDSYSLDVNGVDLSGDLSGKLAELKSAYETDVDAVKKLHEDLAGYKEYNTTNHDAIAGIVAADNATIDTIAANKASYETAAANYTADTEKYDAKVDAYNNSLGKVFADKMSMGDVAGKNFDANDNVVAAVSKIDTNMGTIHGLIESADAKTTSNGRAYNGNLAVGTTVEDHLLALDSSVGDLRELNGQHVDSSKNVALNLQSLNDGIEAETTRAQNAESALEIAINGETERAKGAELTLQNAINDEATARAAADTALQEQINASFAMADSQVLSKANTYTDTRVNKLEKDMSGGVAAATALSAVSVSGVNKGEVSVGGGYGYYNGESAMAFGAAMGLTDNWSINAGAGVASGDSTQFSIRAGTNYKFKLF